MAVETVSNRYVAFTFDPMRAITFNRVLEREGMNIYMILINRRASLVAHSRLSLSLFLIEFEK